MKDSNKRQPSIKYKTQENVVKSKGSSSDHDLHLPIVDGNTQDMVPNVRNTQDKRMNTLTTRTKCSKKSATVTRTDRSRGSSGNQELSNVYGHTHTVVPNTHKVHDLYDIIIPHHNDSE